MIEDQLFYKFSKVIYQEIGLSLPLKKKYLLNTRLAGRLRKLGLSDFESYYKLIQEDKLELNKLCNRITTNVTKFFREKYHFEFLEERVLPSYTGEGQVIRGWSAGCSSGEEAYTLAIILDCFFQDKEIDFKVLATDVNSEVLDYAKKAIYPSERVANIPYHLLKNYFLLGTGENQGFFKVKNELRNNLVFGKVNLNQDNYPIKSKFDFIFCRNVFIYFDQKSREKILDKFYDCLKKDGYLFLGHADGVKIKSNKWRQVWKTTFVKQ